MLATILSSHHLAQNKYLFFPIRPLLLWEGAESLHIDVHRRILNVLCIYTDT